MGLLRPSFNNGPMNLVLVLLIIFLLFGGGFGYHQWGPSGGFGIGGLLLIIIIMYLLGAF
jgi:hypothetical protein